MGTFGVYLKLLVVFSCIVSALADDSTRVTILSKDANGEQTAHLNKPLDITCQVINRPDPQRAGGQPPKLRFQHYSEKNGWVELSADANPSDSNRATVEEDPSKQKYTLQLKTIQLDDGGKYVCKIQTTTEIFISDMVIVKVVAKPQIKLLDSSKNQVKNAGKKDVALTCAADGIPKPSITWSKTGAQTMRNGIVMNATSLIFDSVRASDRGEYKCVALNSVGKTQWTVKLDVTFPPTIKPENDKSVVYQAIGYEAFIVCEVEAYPQVTATTWVFKNQEISRTEETDSVPYTVVILKGAYAVNMKLKIPKVSANDYGDYTCRATNGIGTFERKVTLAKSDQPQETRAGEANVATAAHVSCTVFVSALLVVLGLLKSS